MWNRPHLQGGSVERSVLNGKMHGTEYLGEGTKNHEQENRIYDQHHSALGKAGDEQIGILIGTVVHQCQPVSVQEQRDHRIDHAADDAAYDRRAAVVENHTEQETEKAVADGKAEKECLAGEDGADDISADTDDQSHHGTTEHSGNRQNKESEANLEHVGDPDVEVAEDDVQSDEKTADGDVLYLRQILQLAFEIKGITGNDLHKKYTSICQICRAENRIAINNNP